MARKPPRTLTVGELIAELQQHDPSLPALTSHNYGDHINSLVAPTIRRNQIEQGTAVWSDQHRMWKLIDEGDGREYFDVLVIGPTPDGW